jgi:hypothetical protein
MENDRRKPLRFFLSNRFNSSGFLKDPFTLTALAQTARALRGMRLTER